MSGDAKPLLRRRHAAQLFKTEICKFFLEGRCESGDACSYAHEKNEVRTKPDLTRTSMCRKLLTDGACNDKRCRFAHSEHELRATNGFFKMKMCFFAQSGKCKHGSRCRFAHTMDELRPAGPRKDPELPDAKSAQEEEQRQDSQIDLYSLSSLPERQKSSQQESHGTGGSTATGNGGSTSGNGGSTSGNASGQSSNENSGSGNSRREGDSRPHRGRAAMQARMRTTQNMAEESSSSSGNTSMTLVPRSEHTGSTPASDSSSSGAVGNGDDAVEADGSAAGAPEQKNKTRRSQRRRTSSLGESDGESKNQGEVTLIVSNLPVYLTRGALLSMFEDLTATMRGKFDFFYSPWDLKAGHSLGYAIINFTDSRQAAKFDQQWTDKNLLRKKHPPLKVRKASIQGLTANIEYFSKNLSCPDSRFVPLYRDSEGNMAPLELADGDVESQSVNSWKAEGLSAQKLGPQDLDTGQGGATSKKSAGETCRAVISGSSRPEEHSLQESETRHRRRRNRRRSRQTSMAEAADAAPVGEAPEALQVAEKLSMAPAAWSMPGVQPDLRQLALRHQHQQVLKTMAEKEDRKHTKNQSHSQEAARSSQEAPDMSRLLEAQQLQMLAKQLQQFHASVQMSGMNGVAPTASSAMTWQADSFSQAPTPSTAPTGPNQFMVSPVPAGADSAQLALHMSRQAKQLPVADSQVYNAMSSDLPVGAVTGSAGPPIAPLVPYMMMPVQSVQPVQSLQAALANNANCANAMVAGNFAGGLRYLNGDEVYTD